MKKTFFLSALLFSIAAVAQNNMYVVYSIKGNVSVIDNKTETKAKIGTILDGDETIKVGPASFATLICNETNAFSLSKAGTYTTAALKDSCKVSSGSVSSNYMKYVWSEMTKSKGSPEKNRKAFMSNVGAVSRSINNIWIDPRLDTVNYISGTVPLSWKSYAEAEKFEFKLFDKEAATTPILIKLTDKRHVDVADILKTIQPGKNYWWTAMIKGEDNDERKYFRYWTRDDYNNYFTAISKHEGAVESEAEKEFRVGFILEENHFLAEAYQHYLKATQLAPSVPMYRSVFMSFKKDYEIK